MFPDSLHSSVLQVPIECWTHLMCIYIKQVLYYVCPLPASLRFVKQPHNTQSLIAANITASRSEKILLLLALGFFMADRINAHIAMCVSDCLHSCE